MVILEKKLPYAILAFTLLTIGALWLAQERRHRPNGSDPSYDNRWSELATSSYPPIGRKDEDWTSLAFTGYHGPEFRLTVGEVKQPDTGEMGPSALFAAAVLLQSALDNTQLFDVTRVNTQASRDIESISHSSPTATAQTDQIQPATYLLLPSIDEWAPASRTSGIQMRASITPPEAAQARVAMTFQVVDAWTNQVLFDTAERASIELPENHYASTAEDLSGSGDEAPVCLAARACINKGIWRVANWFKDRPWAGAVSRVQGEEVEIDAGSRRGLAAGMTLAVFSGGRQLFDSETGLAVGSVTQETGRLRIVEAEEQSSIAVIVEGCEGIQPGDRVELQ